MNEPEISVLRFWSPLTADVYRHSVDYEQGFPPDYFTDRELVSYQAAIQEAIDKSWIDEERQCGLRDSMRSSNLREKICDIRPSVAEFGGRLWGVAEVKSYEELHSLEQDTVVRFLERHYEEGWGAAFQNNAIPTQDGDMYVNWWSPVDFSIRTESEFMEDEGIGFDRPMCL